MKLFKGSRLERAIVIIRAAWVLLVIALIVTIFAIGRSPQMTTAVWFYAISIFLLNAVHLILLIIWRKK